MNQETPNQQIKEIRGLTIIDSFVLEVEDQIKQDLDPILCYGDFSNKAPFANFSNHSEFIRKN